MTWYEMKWYDIIWYDIWMVRLKHCSETLTMGILLSIESLWQIPAWLPDQSFHDGSSSILERHIFMKIQGYAKIQMGGPLFRSGSCLPIHVFAAYIVILLCFCWLDRGNRFLLFKPRVPRKNVLSNHHVPSEIATWGHTPFSDTPVFGPWSPVKACSTL